MRLCFYAPRHKVKHFCSNRLQNPAGNYAPYVTELKIRVKGMGFVESMGGAQPDWRLFCAVNNFEYVKLAIVTHPDGKSYFIVCIDGKT